MEKKIKIKERNKKRIIKTRRKGVKNIQIILVQKKLMKKKIKRKEKRRERNES